MKPDTVNSPEYDAKDTGLATFWYVPKFIIRLTTDEGVTGIGETGRGCPAEHVAACCGRRRGRRRRELNWHALEIPRNSAYGCFEMAIFDLWASISACPPAGCWDSRSATGCSSTTGPRAVRPPTSPVRRARARSAASTGSRSSVLWTTPTWSASGRRGAVGPDFKITVDPNTRFYNPAHAMQLADALGDPARHRRLRDPVPKGNLDWYVLLRQKLPGARGAAPRQSRGRARCREAERGRLPEHQPRQHGDVRQVLLHRRAGGGPVWHGSGWTWG